MNIKFIALAVLISLVTGCKKTPTDADIKEAVTKVFAACPSIEVENFIKNNGFIKNDAEQGILYKASVQYDLHVTPNPSLQKQVFEIRSKADSVYSKRHELDAEIKQIMKKGEPLYSKMNKISEQYTPKMKEILKAEGSQYYHDPQLLDELLASDATYRKLQADTTALNDTINLKLKEVEMIDSELNAITFEQNEAIEKIAQAFFSSCKTPTLPLAINIHFSETRTAYTEFKKTFKDELDLIKTDNGWVIKEFYDL